MMEPAWPRTSCYKRFVDGVKRASGIGLMDAITAAHDGQPDDRPCLRLRPPTGRDGKRGGAGHYLGRSRGGLTTKIHVVVDAQASRSGPP